MDNWTHTRLGSERTILKYVKGEEIVGTARESLGPLSYPSMKARGWIGPDRSERTSGAFPPPPTSLFPEASSHTHPRTSPKGKARLNGNVNEGLWHRLKCPSVVWPVYKRINGGIFSWWIPVCLLGRWYQSYAQTWARGSNEKTQNYPISALKMIRLVFFPMLGVEHGASPIPGKCFITELQPQHPCSSAFLLSSSIPLLIS